MHKNSLLNSIENDYDALYCVLRIEKYFENRIDAQVHFTNTNNGDLRVKALSRGIEQNIFTLAWQPRNEIFLCRIFLNYTTDGKYIPEGIQTPQSPTSDSEPLGCEFRFNANNSTDKILIPFIEAAIHRWKITNDAP